MVHALFCVNLSSVCRHAHVYALVLRGRMEIRPASTLWVVPQELYIKSTILFLLSEVHSLGLVDLSRLARE